MSTTQTVRDLMDAEHDRQQRHLSLIASENYVSKAVREASASVLINKYAEGYPGKRYYAGNKIVDEVELLAMQEAKKLFDTDYHVNVQPYAGSTANMVVYSALLEPGDTILALSLAHGGHLTHGHPVTQSGQLYNFVHYGVNRETELIDYDEVEALAKEHKPKLIVCGGSAYPMLIDFARFNKIAREGQSLLMVDMAHFAGLVAGKVYKTPFGQADIITSTTQKTLRGPRGGVIFCRKEFVSVIDRAVFPGMQGGPHMHTIAAKAVAFIEDQEAGFQAYAQQVVKNAQTMAYTLQRKGYRLVADGTDTHLFLLDLKGTGVYGKEAQERLEQVGIVVNMNALPFDTQPPANPSGIRIGTPAVTTRGMKEKEMEVLAECIAKVLEDKKAMEEVADTVAQLSKKFRIPGY